MPLYEVMISDDEAPEVRLTDRALAASAIWWRSRKDLRERGRMEFACFLSGGG